VFPSEVKVFIRENLSGANRVTSYFWARTLSELPNTVMYPIVLASIVYFMVGLRPVASCYYFFHLVIVLVANCAASLGYMISAITSHEAVAYALGETPPTHHPTNPPNPRPTHHAASPLC
jgi:hypothetical protein